ncbi:PEP-CTERM sorting domain-containing protein [Okeania sp. SIO2B3]|uniref:PEP-CTERM sorting domain-containing protein n=1 Tax=Okeania sp. SIO2B3 TaxID=2607784 RepID=UPI0013C24CFD|nr:PEP-CTERM sorting domain-containing protein [Okeania sp. SIO2B3]NET45611.1 PEP-CTERM sorting domain-containing protein [Okeania sp. SIO2B3]
MKTTKTDSLLSKATLFGKSAFIATGVALSTTMFSPANAAATLEFSSSGNNDAGVDYLLRESVTDPGSIEVTIKVNDTGDGIADISGVWFHLANEALIPGLTFEAITATAPDGATTNFITNTSTGANSADNRLGNGTTINGSGPKDFDVGLRIGDSGGINGGDDFSSITFRISHDTEDLDLSQFQEGWATRLKSVGANREGSSKLKEYTNPVYTAAPIVPPDTTSQNGNNGEVDGTWENFTLDFEGFVAGTIIDDEWTDSMGVTISSGTNKVVTLLNSSCNPGYSDYETEGDPITGNCNVTTDGNTNGDPDLATGGSLDTETRGNVLIVQENDRVADSNNNINETPDDNRSGGVIQFEFDEDVFLKHIEFLDYDYTDANKITLQAKDENGRNLLGVDGFEIALENLEGGIISLNNLGLADKQGYDESYAESNSSRHATYFQATHDESVELDNSVWDFYFGNGGLEGVRFLEVDFGGTSGAISELTYKKFTAKKKIRVPEPGSIAALAFIGGGMFLSRRRHSH